MVTELDRALAVLRAQDWRKTGLLSLRGLGLRILPELAAPFDDLPAVVTALDLSGNRLTSLPSWIWTLQRVDDVLLGGNRLASIPEEIGDLVSLVRIDLSDNRLTQIPSGLSGCAALRRLDISGNRIGDLGDICRLRALTALDVADNRLRSLPPLPPALVRLDASANQIEALPATLEELRTLRHVDLSGNLLTSIAPLDRMRLDSLLLDGNEIAAVAETPSASRVSLLGNPAPTSGEIEGQAAEFVQSTVRGAADPHKQYFDAPTYSVGAKLMTAAASDTQRVVDLYYKRFAGLDASVRLGENTLLRLATLSRSTALGLVAGQPTATVEVAPGKRDPRAATMFLAQAAARLDQPELTDSIAETAAGDLVRQADLAGLVLEQEPLPDPPRVLNVALTNRDHRLRRADRTLATEQVYALRVDLGPVIDESVVFQPVPVSTAELPPEQDGGHWFEVITSSSDVEIDPDTDPIVRRLFLPAVGRSDSVFVPFKTRPRAGAASLRVTLQHRSNAIQSIRIDLAVDETGDQPGEVRGTVDYALAEDAARAPDLPPRDVNILTNDAASGTHTIVVADGQAAVSVSVTDSAATEVLSAVRARLTRITLGENGEESQYDDQNSKPVDAFVYDLRMLALSGAQLYQKVLPSVADRASLAGLLNGRARIQVSRVTDTPFPWALIYDLPRDTYDETVALCPMLENWDQERGRLADYPPTCPFESQHAPLNALCPYGFWGFRHLIEQPPSVRSGTLRTSIAVAGGASAAAARALSLDETLTQQHFAALRQTLAGRFKLVECEDRDSLKAAFRDPRLPLAYFYCHGRTALQADVTVPYLEIGDDVRIGPESFGAWYAAEGWGAQHWADVSPLVFLNGCGTAALTPRDIVTFVDAFAGLNAAGVIGTEISVHQRVAGEVALRFYDLFTGARRLSVGEALHRTRIDLLRKGNIAGLIYTPYCSMDLTLDELKESIP